MAEVEVKGVFLHSKNLDSEFMVKCLQMLVNTFPEVKITSVISDELHFGYRVHFLSPNENTVLSRKHLIVSGENIPIAPIRTYLTIHGVRNHGSEQFEFELREAIGNKFGKLLHVTPVFVSNLENEINMKLLAFVDVPELEELEVFNHEGYSDMFVCLPNNNEVFKVTFHCRRCKNDGHVQQSCPIPIPSRENTIPDDDEMNSEEDFGSSAQYFRDLLFCSAGTSSTPPKPTTEVGNVKVSPLIQTCVNKACEEFNFLDRDKLEAFLIHVKNRSRPSDFAKYFTSDPAKLKQLLQRSIELFYRTPQAGTPEDKQVIRWLEGLVDRFEGPKKWKFFD